MRFEATVLSSGKTATGIEVPPEVVDALGKGRKPPVRVTLHSYTYRTTVATVDGRYMVGVSAEVRERAGVAAGDVLDVEIELDESPREVEVPEDLAAALSADPAAGAKFASLSYSGKVRLVAPIANAKRPETRQRNVDKAIAELRAN